jgi:hypothetical protein
MVCYSISEFESSNVPWGHSTLFCTTHSKGASDMSLKLLNDMNGMLCACGKTHSFSAKVIAGEGVLAQLPDRKTCKEL